MISFKEAGKLGAGDEEGESKKPNGFCETRFCFRPPRLPLQRCAMLNLRLARLCSPSYWSVKKRQVDGCCDRWGPCMEAWVDRTLRALGPVYVLAALLLILSVVYVYFTVILPAACDFPSWHWAFHFLLALWLAYSVLLNYYLCVATHPGSPPQEPAVQAAMRQYEARMGVSGVSGESLVLPDEHLGFLGLGSLGLHPSPAPHHTPSLLPPNSNSSVGSNSKSSGGGGMSAGSCLPLVKRWCRICQSRKAPMTHHCYVCNRCVLKMDHHCPWMSNCVGFRNYRYFFCFVLYLWLGCAYAVYMSSSLLFISTTLLGRGALVLAARPTSSADPGAANYTPRHHGTGVVFTFVMALAVFLALSLLLSWHLYLVATAQTTIDFYDYRTKRAEARRTGRVWKNEFDLGLVHNFIVAFELGPPWWGLSLLLPNAVAMKGDGMTFPTASSPRTAHALGASDMV